MAVITSPVENIIFLVAWITLSVDDTSLLVAKIIFLAAKLTFNVAVIASVSDI